MNRKKKKKKKMKMNMRMRLKRINIKRLRYFMLETKIGILNSKISFNYKMNIIKFRMNL